MIACVHEGPPLALRLFGPIEVSTRGKPLPRLRRRKGFWMLALLALRSPQEVSRSWLAGMLWPDSPEPKALCSLRALLVELRQALGPETHRLRSPTKHTLQLPLEGVEVDVHAFDAALAVGDETGLREAVALYRGTLLEGCTEEWVLQERRPREQAYLQALATLASHASARAEHALAEQYLRRVIGVNGLRENAQRALMLAQAAQGNYAAALESAREMRLLLHREINTEPSSETKAVIQHIREAARREAAAGSESDGEEERREAGEAETLGRGDARPVQAAGPRRRVPTPAPSRIPRPLTRLIGREAEVREVAEHLAQARLVTLTGAGGVGKSRLAIRVAEGAARAFPDGVWFVELAPLTDVGLVPQSVAQVLELPEQPGRPRIQTLVEFLQPKTVLLVLDNCEHLVAGCAALAERLLRACARLTILTTSRRSLGITGERTWRVPSLAVPDADAWALGRHPWGYEAVRLFADRVRDAMPEFEMGEQQAPTAVRICRRLDGIPLAIELAAARLKALPLETLAERLEVGFGLLTGGSRAALERHQTLRATLAWSYDLLAEPERGLLRRLSVFAGGWTLEAAEAVCGEGRCSPSVGCSENPASTSSTLHRHVVLDLLTSLVGQSLVQYEGGSVEGRYRLLETVREYGWERLRESGEEAVVRGRHRDWFLALAEQAEPELHGPQEAAWLERLEREHDNLRAALTWSKLLLQMPHTDHGSEAVPQATPAEEAEKALRLGGALREFWSTRCYWEEGRQILGEMLAATAALPCKRARARALLAAGKLAFHQQAFGAIGHWEPVRLLLQESRALFEGLGDKGGLAEALLQLGLVAMHQGDAARERSLGEQSLALYRETGDTFGNALALFHRGGRVRRGGDVERARLLWEESVALARAGGHLLPLSWGLLALAACAQMDGEPTRVRALQEQSALLERVRGDGRGIAWSLCGLARTVLGQGEHERAGKLCRECLALFRDLGRPNGIARALGILAEVALAGEQPEVAARLLGAAEAIWEDDYGTVPSVDPLCKFERLDPRSQVALLRTSLCARDLADAWAEGRAMTPERAVMYALECDGADE
jgi:predicted ATPase/DNA-binding SARP family transcriptional activator/tetratricopeptide (TPR) repeat protein